MIHTSARATVTVLAVAALGVSLAIAPVHATTTSPSWAAPSSGTSHPLLPSVVVTPGGAVAAWVRRNGSGKDAAVQVCVMPAGGTSCSKLTTLPWPPAQRVNPQYILGDIHPAVTQYSTGLGTRIKVAIAGNYAAGPDLEVVVWTSTDGGQTFTAGPEQQAVVPANLGGLAFQAGGSPLLYAWSKNSPTGASVTVLDTNGGTTCASCGTVSIDSSYLYGTIGGGVVGLPNGAMVVVAEDFSAGHSHVRVWRLAAGQSPMVPANWTIAQTFTDESFGAGGLRSEGLVANGTNIALLTETTTTGQPRVRRWSQSMFDLAYTGAAGVNYVSPAVGVDGSGRAYLFNYAGGPVKGRLVRPTSGTAFTVAPTPAIGKQYSYPAVALGGAGYGVYAYTVAAGSPTDRTTRFVPLRVPHSLTVTTAASATPHYWELTIREPAATATTTTVTIKKVVAGLVKSTTTASVAPGATKKVSVRPTAKTTYVITALAGAWWTAKSTSVTLSPR